MSFTTRKNNIIFGLTKSDQLAKIVAKKTGITLGKSHVSKFADGEILFTTDVPVRGLNVFLIQSTCRPVNDSIMELLIAIDAMRRASAKSISVIIPYYGYSRQDRKSKGREPITAKLLADMLQLAGATRILTIDIHSQQQQGFFNIPFDSLSASWLLLDKFIKSNKKITKNIVVVAPDYGSVKRSRSIAEKIGAYLAIVDKRRPKANQVRVSDILGNVKGKYCLIVDDMIDTGGTMLSAAKLLKDKGATDVFILATHALFNGNAINEFEKAKKDKIINQVLVTDTIPNKLPNFMQIVSVADLIAHAIDVFVGTPGESMSKIYNHYKFFNSFE